VVATGTHFLALLEDGWVVQRDHRLGGLPSTEHQVLPPHHSIIAIAANELYSAALSGPCTPPPTLAAILIFLIIINNI
jgi:hypothetical protein